MATFWGFLLKMIVQLGCVLYFSRAAGIRWEKNGVTDVN
jgi:hypothetical protein